MNLKNIKLLKTGDLMKDTMDLYKDLIKNDMVKKFGQKQVAIVEKKL